MGTEKKSAELLTNLLSAKGHTTIDADWENGGNRLAGTFSDLIDVMDIAMWQLDLDYRVVGYNQKAKEIYGEQAWGIFAITRPPGAMPSVVPVLQKRFTMAKPAAGPSISARMLRARIFILTILPPR